MGSPRNREPNIWENGTEEGQPSGEHTGGRREAKQIIATGSIL